MKKIGLTGGIGSGKTTVLNLFQELGAGVYIADKEARRIMHEDSSVIGAVQKLFGNEAYINGTLNRAYIANIVFKNKKQLTALNAIVHPAVHSDFLKFCKEQKAPYVIYESALLLDNGVNEFWDKVVLITAPVELRIQRVVERDQLTSEQVQARINNQIPDAEKRKIADYVIENVDWEATKAKVIELHHSFANGAD